MVEKLAYDYAEDRLKPDTKTAMIRVHTSTSPYFALLFLGHRVTGASYTLGPRIRASEVVATRLGVLWLRISRHVLSGENAGRSDNTIANVTVDRLV